MSTINRTAAWIVTFTAAMTTALGGCDARSRGPAEAGPAPPAERSGLADTAGMPDEDPLAEFFRRFGIPRPDHEEPRGPQRGMGSGFIVSADGYILTNAHVVGNASEVTVKLTDRREFSAKVMGVDAPSDVAVNPGNSGGPLFNLQGEVIGMNSQIYSRSGGYMGLSFAIPIDVARSVQEQIIRTGHVERGRIGIAVQDMNAQLADSFGLDRARGALVSSVEAGGPADRTGIRPGDVVLQVNGESIERSNQLPTRIAALKPGTAATLVIWHDRARFEVKLRVSEVKDPGARVRSSGRGAEESPVLGLSVRPLTPEERDAVRTQGTLVVTEVSGRAAIAGVVPDDLAHETARQGARGSRCVRRDD